MGLDISYKQHLMIIFLDKELHSEYGPTVVAHLYMYTRNKFNKTKQQQQTNKHTYKQTNGLPTVLSNYIGKAFFDFPWRNACRFILNENVLF